jgi:hypothetical protein
VAGQDRALHLGQHRVVVSDDAGEPWAAVAHPGQKVFAKLFLDCAVPVAAGTKLTDRPDGFRR